MIRGSEAWSSGNPENQSSLIRCKIVQMTEELDELPVDGHTNLWTGPSLWHRVLSA